MKEIVYSSPGKIILSGEHSVVYTKPALVCAVDFRLKVALRSLVHSSVEKDPALAYCHSLVVAYLQKESIPVHDVEFEIEITSTIPQGRGMGSSAAYCTAVCAALFHWYSGRQPTKEEIGNLAFAAEKHFHGIPSGVDVSACTHGGLIFYRKEFEFLKTISSLHAKLPAHFTSHMFLIDSGAPEETTKEMVTLVGKRYNTHPARMERVLYEIEKITKRMTVSIVKEDVGFFRECIEKNEVLLQQLGIVSRRTSRLLRLLRQFGVGKVTGAGGVKKGSGFILFYADDMEKLQRYLSEKKIDFIPFVQSFEGCRLETVQ